MGLLAYLVAGAIVAWLVRAFRREAGDPRMLTMVVFGLAGGGVGGLGWNLVQDESIDHLDGIGFTAAVLVALVLVAGVQVRSRRQD